MKLTDLDVQYDGGALLEDVRGVLNKYVILPSDHAVVAVVLWIAATHGIRAFEHATRLAIHSAVKRSGKSRLLEVIEALVHGPISTTNINPAPLFRLIEAGGARPPTLLLDEADRLFGSAKKDEDNRDLIAILNNGFRQGLPTYRCVGPLQTPTAFSNFAMAAIAGIGRKPDTIEDRAVNITMRRRKPGETVAKFRLKRDLPELHKLRAKLADWAEQVAERLAETVTDIPPELEDRAEDAWEPLLAVADAARGDWPKLAREAAVKLAQDAAEADSHQSEEIRLLADVAAVFASMPHVGFLASGVLLHELRKVEDAPWGDQDFTARKLALRLAKFDVRPRHNVAKTERGYHQSDLRDAFSRYLPSDPSDPSETAADQGEHAGRDENAGRVNPSGPVDPSARNSRPEAQGTGRTGRTGGTGAPRGAG